MTTAKATSSLWGVYDQHTREWVVPATLSYERDAWVRLLQVDSLHPWELCVRVEDEEKGQAGEVLTECPECTGAGDCDGCGRECLRCDGDGEVRWEDLTAYEQDLQRRRGIAPKDVAA
jgi:hypothetical protein